jgi:hypothetical protein
VPVAWKETRRKTIVGVGVLASLIAAAGPGHAQTVCGFCTRYSTLTTNHPFFPGQTDIGNHCDDCTTTIALPFTVHVEGGNFTAVTLSSNGTAQFLGDIAASANTCLPSAIHDTTIFAHWDDLSTDAQPGCSAYPGGQCGIFTQQSGPNFYVEWRAVYASSPTEIANFEIQLIQDDDDFWIIMGTLGRGGTGATVGVQCENGTVFQEIACNRPATQAYNFFCPFPVELSGFTVE